MFPRRVGALAFVLACLVTCLVAAPTVAQEVRGDVREQGSGAPLAGALVTLLTAEGDEADRSLSDAGGRYGLAAPPGRYRIRVERIGLATWESEPFLLEVGGSRTLDVTVPSRAVPLLPVAVEAADRRCSTRPRAGAAAARLWEEARKALRATELSGGDESSPGFRVRRYERVLSASLDTVEERSTVADGVRGTPFEAVPPETLEEAGFVRGDPDTGLRFFAPDAPSLLSDAFADAHCFRVRREGRSPELVGLAFEPSGRHRGALEGTLWLQRETSRLSHLEFGYPNLDLGQHVDTDGLGGRVEFDRLDGGAWIVRSWRIRMPRLERGWIETLTRRELALTLVGYEEEGGEVLGATRRTTISRRPPRTVAGTLHDSVGGGPLTGAVVSVEGTSLSTTTDAQGRFRLDARDAPFDELTLRVEHPRLEMAGVAIERRLNVGPGQMARLTLATPSVATLLRARCPPGDQGPRSGTVIGLVEDAETGQALAGVRVTIAWEGAEVPLEARSDASGFYHACGLPPGVEVDVTAGGVAGGSSSTVRVRAPAGGLIKVDLDAEAP